MDVNRGGNNGGSLGEKDWKKFVTLIPPNALLFKEQEDGKGSSSLQITNRSTDNILFKVKTTVPNNYIVRPNQGII